MDSVQRTCMLQCGTLILLFHNFFADAAVSYTHEAGFKLSNNISRVVVEKSQPRVVLKCPINGGTRSKSMYEWKINGESTDFYMNVKVPRKKENTLRISDADESSSGIYHCRVTDGTSSLNARIYVLIYPEGPTSIFDLQKKYDVIIDAKDVISMNYKTQDLGYKPILGRNQLPVSYQSGSAESIHTLSCEIEANPSAKYKWLWNGIRLPTTVRSIRISNPGVYICNAENMFGHTNITFHYQHQNGKAHEHEMQVQERRVNPGDEVLLECFVPAPAKSDILWFKKSDDSTNHGKDKSMAYNYAGSTYYLQENTMKTQDINPVFVSITLKIDAAYPTSAGLYYCLKVEELENTSSELVTAVHLMVGPEKDARNYRLFSFRQWPVLVGVIAAMLLTLGIVVTCFCHRRKSKYPRRR